MNFGTVSDLILVNKKDPPVCFEFWYGLRPNSGETERPYCKSWNSVRSATKFLSKKEGPSYMFWILVESATKFWWKKDPSLFPEFWYGLWPNSGEKKTLLYVLSFGTLFDQNLLKKDTPLCNEFMSSLRLNSCEKEKNLSVFSESWYGLQ